MTDNAATITFQFQDKRDGIRWPTWKNGEEVPFLMLIPADMAQIIGTEGMQKYADRQKKRIRQQAEMQRLHERLELIDENTRQQDTERSSNGPIITEIEVEEGEQDRDKDGDWRIEEEVENRIDIGPADRPVGELSIGVDELQDDAMEHSSSQLQANPPRKRRRAPEQKDADEPPTKHRHRSRRQSGATERRPRKRQRKADSNITDSGVD